MEISFYNKLDKELRVEIVPKNEAVITLAEVEVNPTVHLSDKSLTFCLAPKEEEETINTRKAEKVLWNNKGTLLAVVEYLALGSRVCFFDFDINTLTFTERSYTVDYELKIFAHLSFSPDDTLITISPNEYAKKPDVFNIEDKTTLTRVLLDPEYPDFEASDNDTDYLNGVRNVTFSEDNKYLLYNVYGNKVPETPRLYLYKYDEVSSKYIRIRSMDSIHFSYGSLITRSGKFILSSTRSTTVFILSEEELIFKTFSNQFQDKETTMWCKELQNGYIVEECDSSIVMFKINNVGLIQERIVHPVPSGSGRLISYANNNTAISFDYDQELHLFKFSNTDLETVSLGSLTGIDYFNPPSLNPTNSLIFAVQSVDRTTFIDLFSIEGDKITKLKRTIKESN